MHFCLSRDPIQCLLARFDMTWIDAFLEPCNCPCHRGLPWWHPYDSPQAYEQAMEDRNAPTEEELAAENAPKENLEDLSEWRRYIFGED